MGSFNALKVLLAPWGYCLRLCKILGKVWFGEWTEYIQRRYSLSETTFTTGEIWGIWFTTLFLNYHYYWWFCRTQKLLTLVTSEYSCKCTESVQILRCHLLYLTIYLDLAVNSKKSREGYNENIGLFFFLLVSEKLSFDGRISTSIGQITYTLFNKSAQRNTEYIYSNIYSKYYITITILPSISKVMSNFRLTTLFGAKLKLFYENLTFLSF